MPDRKVKCYESVCQNFFLLLKTGEKKPLGLLLNFFEVHSKGIIMFYDWTHLLVEKMRRWAIRIHAE